MKQITDYIKQNYNPLSIIIYGSYANGTNNLNSDFDALVITSTGEFFHDTSFVNGIQLDVFVYPESYFNTECDCNDFVQIFDGKIILDTDDKAKMFQQKVLDYLKNKPRKSNAEIKADIDWCIKMLERTKRNDAEGMYRWHWLLVDSLEIFCEAVHHPYLGPKKSLIWMQDNHPTAFSYYNNALSNFNINSLSEWISHLSSYLVR